jgi:hypothetical protein
MRCNSDSPPRGFHAPGRTHLDEPITPAARGEGPAPLMTARLLTGLALLS